MEDQLLDIYDYIWDPNRFGTAIFAILLTAVFGIVTGPMQGNSNPFLWLVFDKIFGSIGGRLDRPNRTGRELMFRGMFVSFFALVAAYYLGVGAKYVSLLVPLYGFTEIYMLAMAITCGSVWFTLLRLYFSMEKKRVTKCSYYAVAHSVRADLSALDDFSITRLGMGYAAFALDKGLVAPVFWYLLTGLPGAFLYAGVAMLAWRFGKEGFSKGFGRLPLALEQLMGFVPHVLTGIIVSCAGLFTPTGGFTRAFIGQYWGGDKAPYYEGGYPLKALSYSLKVSLGGPYKDLDGSAVKREWVGPEGATAQLSVGHLRRAIYLHAVAVLIYIVAIAWAILWSGILVD